MKKILILIMIMLCGINTAFSIAPDADLLAWWEMEDLTDSSGNGRTLTNTGATLTSIGCHSGDCFDFDGSGNFMEAIGFTYNRNNMTICVYSERDISATGDMVSIYSGPGGYATLHTVGDTAQFFTSSASNKVTAATFSNNVNRQFCLNYDGTTTRIYVNGVLNDSGATSFGLGTANWHLGRTASGGNFFDGTLDEISIWNRSLSASDVLSLFQNGITTGPTIVTNLSSIYATQNFSLNLTSGSLTNMSYFLDADGEVSICNNCTFSTLTLTNQSIGDHTISFKSLSGAGSVFTNQTFEIQPFQFFRFNDTNTNTLITNYTFGGVDSVGNLVTLDARNFTFGNNTLTFEKVGFISSNFTIVFNNTMQINDTIDVNIATIVLSIFNRETLDLLNGTTFITLQSSVGFNGTTTTGLLNISNTNFLSEQYQILAEHAGFTSENVFFNYNNQEILNVNIFMLNSTSPDTGTIQIIVKNSLSQLVESAVCSALEWRPSQSAFITVAQGLTNVNGETLLNIELNTKIYKFSCTKDVFTTVTNAQIVQIDGSSLTIILNDILLVPTTLFPNLATSLTNSSINATHQLVTYTFSDSDGLTTEGCLQSFFVNGNRQTFIEESCISSSTGSILLTVDINQSSDIRMQGVLTTPTVTDYVTDTLTFKGFGNIAFEFAKVGLDILIPTIFILLGLGLGILLLNINIAVILMATGAWLAVALVPSVMSGSIAMFITVIVGFMLWGGFTRK